MENKLLYTQLQNSKLFKWLLYSVPSKQTTILTLNNLCTLIRLQLGF